MTPETLRSYAEALPAGSVVPVPREMLLGILDGSVSRQPVPDLTVADAAKILGRAASTVRLWCHAGAIGGAYLYRKREYRIPPAALEAFQAEERTRVRGESSASHAERSPDMNAWKRHLKRAG